MDHLSAQTSQKIIDKFEVIFFEIKEEIKFLNRSRIKSYIDGFFKRASSIKTILHGNSPKSFYEIYFDVELSCQGKSYKKYDVGRLFNINNNLIVTADAGSGKSMLFKHLILNTINTGFGIPVLIELRNLNAEEVGLLDYVYQQFSDHLCESKRVREKLLEKGELVFFFDGFDEVKNDLKSRTIEGIKLLSAKYPNNKVFISSRPFTKIDMIETFSIISISPLTRTRVIEFIKKQLDDAEISRQVCSSIEKAQNSRIASFLRNPLLLTLYILTYQNNSEIPEKVTLFYRRVVDALFIEHDSKSKVGFQRERRSRIDFSTFEEIVKQFAFFTFFREMFAFDKEFARTTLGTLIMTNDRFTFTADELIEDLLMAFSIWVEDGGILSFSHKSLQEYFAALFIRDSAKDSKKRIYAELQHRLNKGEYVEIRNFTTLLAELDLLDCREYFLIPITKELLTSLGKIGTNYEFLVYLAKRFFVRENKVHVLIEPWSPFLKLENVASEMAKSIYNALSRTASSVFAQEIRSTKARTNDRLVSLTSLPKEKIIAMNSDRNLSAVIKALSVDLENLSNKMRKSIEEDKKSLDFVMQALGQ